MGEDGGAVLGDTTMALPAGTGSARHGRARWAPGDGHVPLTLVPHGDKRGSWSREGLGGQSWPWPSRGDLGARDLLPPCPAIGKGLLPSSSSAHPAPTPRTREQPVPAWSWISPQPHGWSPVPPKPRQSASPATAATGNGPAGHFIQGCREDFHPSSPFLAPQSVPVIPETPPNRPG